MADSRIRAALSCTLDYEKILSKDLKDILEKVASSCSCTLDMIFLPFTTVCSSLMGFAEIKTHRDEINFSRPNVMWTMVAADPGEYNNYEFRDHGFCFAMSIQVHTYMNTNLGTHLSSFLAFDMDLRQIQR